MTKDTTHPLSSTLGSWKLSRVALEKARQEDEKKLASTLPESSTDQVTTEVRVEEISAPTSKQKEEKETSVIAQEVAETEEEIKAIGFAQSSVYAEEKKPRTPEEETQFKEEHMAAPTDWQKDIGLPNEDNLRRNWMRPHRNLSYIYPEVILPSWKRV